MSAPRRSPDELLKEWRNSCFFDDQLTLSEVADSVLNDEKPIVEARQGTGTKASRWTLFNTNTNEEAVLVHAAIWHSNTPLDTGNFVPAGEKAPRSVADNRVQKVVGFKCDTSYNLDTTIDESLWNNLSTLESFVQKYEGFNRSERERSHWQDGSRREMYILSSKLFVRQSTKPKKATFEPHEWLKTGLAAQKWPEYVVNPDRPLYYDLVDGVSVKLENSKPPYYKRGDIVWFAFKLSFFVSRENWSSEIIPIEFLRVESGKGLYTDLPEEDDEADNKEEVRDDNEGGSQPRLAEGQAVMAIARTNNVPRDRKRSSEDHSDAETLQSNSSSGGIKVEDGSGDDGKADDAEMGDSSPAGATPDLEEGQEVPKKKRARKSRQ